jgi:hypothetical protein
VNHYGYGQELIPFEELNIRAQIETEIKRIGIKLTIV